MEEHEPGVDELEALEEAQHLVTRAGRGGERQQEAEIGSVVGSLRQLADGVDVRIDVPAEQGDDEVAAGRDGIEQAVLSGSTTSPKMNDVDPSAVLRSSGCAWVITIGSLST